MEVLIPFILASVLILVIPGPTVILIITQSVAHGRKSAVPLVAGVLLGDVTAMVLSLLGLGAVLSASAALFNIFKWVGALYLIWLGIRLWRSNPEAKLTSQRSNKGSIRSIMGGAFIVSALNPKGIAFYVAFLPQFVDPLRPAVPQLLMLGGIFLLMALINDSMFAVFAGRLSEQMKRIRVRKWFNRCGGAALVGAGIFTAGMRRAA